MRSAGQIRAARALLNWTQAELSERTEISIPTIKRIESKGTAGTSVRFAEALDQVFQDAGIEFIADGTSEGVKGELARLNGEQTDK